ncbi:hypothetical protein BDN70DRAFT_901360 [Pholiota conissans]|uniref:Uncharacterized protein n=1 Tax=Pholiota conissans TaxID=109636 RepID=A0A9P5YP70_9AGAR|nr:hypothetical protein BDN70DRAFT_901360 [Pholiota conissans]
MQDKSSVSMPSETTDRVVGGAASSLAAPTGASVVPAAPDHGAVAVTVAPTALAASTVAAPAGASVVPVAPAHGAVTVTIAPTAQAHAASVVAAASACDVNDPFITDNSMDTREDGFNPNFSSVRVPHPFELQEPNPRPINYFVVNVGTPVGIIGDLELSSIDLHRQPQLAFTRCNGWYEAVGHYTINFRNGNIRLVPLGAGAPQMPNNLQHVAIMEHASGVPRPLHPPAGSASNPIYVGSPDTAVVVAGPTQNSRTPTPAARSTRDRGTGPFRIPLPIPVRRGAPIPGATRIRRRRRQSTSTTTATTGPAPAPSSAVPAPGGAAPGVSTAAAPTAVASTVSSTAASTAVASTVIASTAAVSTVVASTTVSSIPASGSANASNGAVNGTHKVINVSDFSDIESSRQVPKKRQARDIVPQINVHDSDSDGPDFLPSYPQAQGRDSSHASQTSRPCVDTARTTPPTTDRAASSQTSSPLTELGPTPPSTPQPGQKVFQSLFSVGGVSCKGKGKGKDKGKGKAKESSPVLEHFLRSNKRYKLTDKGRSLCLPGADPSSLPTNIPAADGADPVAGPSSVSVNDALTIDAPPIAGPSNSHVSDTSIEDGNDGDDEDDGLVNNEYPHWDFKPDEIDEVGRIMDEAWKHSQAKRK